MSVWRKKTVMIYTGAGIFGIISETCRQVLKKAAIWFAWQYAFISKQSNFFGSNDVFCTSFIREVFAKGKKQNMLVWRLLWTHASCIEVKKRAFSE